MGLPLDLAVLDEPEQLTETLSSAMSVKNIQRDPMDYVPLWMRVIGNKPMERRYNGSKGSI